MKTTKSPQELVLDILKTGITQVKLAERAQCSQSLINALSKGIRGKRISLEIGLRLIKLHSSICNSRKKSFDH